MRRTTSLTLAALAGLVPSAVVLAPTSAAGQTCRGEAATIVGTPGSGRALEGTEGRDVVVTNGSGADVLTLGGDDLVCVTGTARRPVLVNVYAGDGNDVVDGTGSRGWSIIAMLGVGADRFEGGNSENQVFGNYEPVDSDTEDTEADVLVGGTGPDHVISGSRGPNADVIDLGGGDDDLSYSGSMAGGGSITGGDGSDTVQLDTVVGTNRVDNAAGQLVTNGGVAARWSDIEEFLLHGPAGPSDLEFVGTDADESVLDWTSAGGRATISLGGGDDTYEAEAPGPGSRIDAGTGSRDRISLASLRTGLDLDLATGQLDVAAATPYTIEAPGFDDASLFAPQVVLRGTARDNDLTLRACAGTVHGLAGDDTIKRRLFSFDDGDLRCVEKLRALGGDGDDSIVGTRGADVLSGGAGRDRLAGAAGSDRLLGGGGNDLLLGSHSPDTLLGGAGRDRADGGKGRDRCAAELRRHCER